MKNFYSKLIAMALLACLMVNTAPAQQTPVNTAAAIGPIDVDVLEKRQFDSVNPELGIITLEGVDYELNLIDDGFFARAEKWKPLKQLRSGKKYIVHIYFENEAAMKQRKGGSVVYIGELPPPY